MRLLIAGDSSAAGVGASSQDEALSGQLVRHLARSFSLEWQLEATTGHTTRDTLQQLRNVTGPFDVAVTALGVNDTTRATSRKAFVTRQTALMSHISEVLGARLIVAAAVPQLQLFPALPQPLAWVLGQQSQRLNQGLAQVADLFPQMCHHHTDFPADPAFAASDGYHPSPRAYALWAASIAQVIRDQADRFI